MLPIVHDFDRYDAPCSPVVRRLYGDGRPNILFVGRVIPNKRIEDLIRVFAVYKGNIDWRSRLLLVGDYRGHERYLRRLQEMVERYRIEDVVLTGHVEDDDLRAYYSVADVFLCLSEHEGYCVPVVEAMYFGVPVVAFDAGAVRETLRGGGVLLTTKERPEEVAHLVHEVVANPALRRSVLETQRRAIAGLRGTDFGALLLDRLQPVLEERR